MGPVRQYCIATISTQARRRKLYVCPTPLYSNHRSPRMVSGCCSFLTCFSPHNHSTTCGLSKWCVWTVRGSRHSIVLHHQGALRASSGRLKSILWSSTNISNFYQAPSQTIILLSCIPSMLLLVPSTKNSRRQTVQDINHSFSLPMETVCI